MKPTIIYFNRKFSQHVMSSSFTLIVFVVFYFYMNQEFTVVEMSDALNNILLCSDHMKFNRNMYCLVACVHWNHEFYKIDEQSNNMLKYFHYSGIRSRTSQISFQFSCSFSLYTIYILKYLISRYTF